ncbi:MAG TPA: hypothetical protein VL918_00325 [Sphingobium sp.]|nr:hypothetical protein [Sphingobium sp.]
MGKYVMVVQSQAKEGRDDEFNDWYDSTHYHDICAIPGVKSGRRFDATPVGMGAPGMRYLAIYEIETDDPASVMAEIGKRSASGSMKGCDAVDGPSTILWFYKDRQSDSQ